MVFIPSPASDSEHVESCNIQLFIQFFTSSPFSLLPSYKIRLEHQTCTFIFTLHRTSAASTTSYSLSLALNIIILPQLYHSLHQIHLSVSRLRIAKCSASRYQDHRSFLKPPCLLDLVSSNSRHRLFYNCQSSLRRTSSPVLELISLF